MGKEKSIGKGYVQVYTGNGKGKTTAALGLALRAAGRGFRIYMGQFIKGQPYGELSAVQMLLPHINIEQYGRGEFIHVKASPDKEDIQAAQNGLERASDRMLCGDYDVIILDEILTAYHFNLVSQSDILAFMSKKPPALELILTGRYAPQAVMDAADLVTEMREVKHYFQQGVAARMGIEY
jgi:cob(I)alamin adenosyltransferase